MFTHWKPQVHTHALTHTLTRTGSIMNEWLWMDGCVHLAPGCSQPRPWNDELTAACSGGWQALDHMERRGEERRGEERRGEERFRGEERGRTPWGRWWSMQLRFPVSDVRPAWIDGSAGARPAHSNLPALYNSRSHPPFVSILISFSFLYRCCHLSLSPLLSPFGFSVSPVSVTTKAHTCSVALLWDVTLVINHLLLRYSLW